MVLDKIRGLFGSRDGRRATFSVVSARLAIECYAKLTPQIRHRVGTMRLSEIRGYLRARLHDTLPHQVEAICRQWRLPASRRHDLIDQTLDQLSTLCIRIYDRRMVA